MTRWRALLLAPAAASMLGGLLAAGFLLVDSDRHTGLQNVHGVLMVLGFLGTSIALERAVALGLGRGLYWGYAAPATLGLGGVLLVRPAPLAAAQALLVLGCAISMVMAHAAVILPAVLRIPLPYTPAFWLPLGLLHAGLAIRFAGRLAEHTTIWITGSSLNIAALLVFAAIALWSAVRGSTPEPKRRPIS